MDYDVLVVGGGIAGMESGLTLGDMGYKVLLVEKEASIGGKMILLSKVFPTLDCSSCISTPKMAATAHHPNLTVMTYSEVEGIVRKGDGTFAARLLRKPAFVDPAACTGCGDCELACTVAISDKFNAGLVATPTFAVTLGWSERFRHSLDLGTRSVLHGEQSFEYARPIVAGDRLTIRSKVADVQERAGASGPMDVIVIEDEGRDEQGVLVFRSRATFILRRG